MRRSTFTVNAEIVQGNAGAEVTFSALTVGEWKAYGVDPAVNDHTLIRDHIVSWSGIVDSNDTTPAPTDDPSDLESDHDPTDIVVIRPLPSVGGEAIRPDKSQLLLSWILDLLD